MKIILDNRRPMPEKGPYNCCRTYEECTLLIRIFKDIKEHFPNTELTFNPL